MTNVQELFARRLAGSVAAVTSLGKPPLLGRLVAIADKVRDCLSRGGTIYTCGNGGSAAESLHLAEELIGRYRSNRPPLRAISLNADTTALTCIANDFGFEQIFARQCDALLTAKDALIIFSTSGNSENLVQALHAAKRKIAMTIGMLGGAGGRCAALCDLALLVPSADSAHIQEAHQVALHLLCESLES